MSSLRRRAPWSKALLLVLLVILAGCEAIATPTPTATATLTPAPSPTPSATPSLTPTPTATATVTPTATRTPPATPSPVVTLPPSLTVEYSNSFYGFALRYPVAWSEEEPGGNDPVVIISGPLSDPSIWVSFRYQLEATSAEESTTSYLDQIGPALGGIVVESQGAITLAEDTAAYETIFATSGSDPLRFKLVVATQGTQQMEAIAFTSPGAFEERLVEIDTALYSLEFRAPAPLGISRQESLVLADNGPATLDPHLVQDIGSSLYVTNIFSGLVKLDRDLQPTGDLAESWDINSSKTEYTFHLRPGATFHNGKPVTAQDFKYSFERATDAATGSPTAGSYLRDIVGVAEKLAGAASAVSGVQVVNDSTLRITIDAPKAYFLSKLTYPTAFVLDRDNVEAGGDWTRTPNGTGPFKLKAWQPDELIVLERFEGYYPEAAKVPYIVFRLFAGVPINMYENGEIDVAYLGSGDLERAEDPGSGLSDQLRVYTQLTTHYIGLYSQTPPFDDPKVRRAFALALDRAYILETVLNGINVLASGILPPGMPGYNPELQPLPFDPAEALRLIGESQYRSVEGLPPVVYLTAGFGIVDSVTAAMVQQWRDNLGVEVSVRQLFPSQYYSRLDEGLGNLFDYGWVADYPDPENFLDILFHSGASNNYGGYDSAQFDALILLARTEQDVAARMLLYQRAEEQLLQDAAAIPLWHPIDYVLVKPYVRGWEVNATGLPRLTEVSVEYE